MVKEKSESRTRSFCRNDLSLTNRENMEKLSLKTKLSYGVAGIGDSASYNLIGSFVIFFLTTIAGVNPAIAGTIAGIGAVWETICGAVIGYISDNSMTKIGKRKPFLLLASFPLAFFTALLFTAVDLPQTIRVIYYAVMVILFWTAFAMFFVPYLAWGAELTQNYDERTSLRGYVYFFNALGGAIGTVLPTIIVDFLMQYGKNPAQSWQALGIFCGLCSGLTIFIGAMGIKDRMEQKYRGDKSAWGKVRAERKARPKQNPAVFLLGMVKNYLEILKLRTARFVILASIFYLIGYAIFIADRIYFYTYNLEYSAGPISLLLAYNTALGVLFVPFLTAVGKKLDKRSTYIWGMGLSVVAMILFGFTGITSLAAILVFTFMYCVGSICYWQLIPSMIYDVCEVDELMNYKQRAGLVTSLQTLSEALGNAIGMQILGLILDFAGFAGDHTVQSETVLTWMHYSFTIIPSVMFILSIIMIVKYPVTKSMYDRVLRALERRRAGENVDLKEFACLK